MKLETIFQKLFPLRYELAALRLQVAHMQGECAGMRMNLETSIKQLHRIETTLVNSQKVALERDISIRTDLGETRKAIALIVEMHGRQIDKLDAIQEKKMESAQQVVHGRGWEAHRERIKPHVEKQYEEAEAARRTPRIPVGPDAGSSGAPDVARIKADQAGVPNAGRSGDIATEYYSSTIGGSMYRIPEPRTISGGLPFKYIPGETGIGSPIHQVPDDGSGEEGTGQSGKEPNLPQHPRNG